jgi:hypothetical protein
MARSRPWALILHVVVLVGCSIAPPYFDINSEFHQAGPIAVGETAYIGVAFLRTREGDTVELQSLELIDPVLGAADVEALVVDMRAVGGDSVGFVSGSDPMTAAAAVAGLAPIEGFAFTAAESWHPISIVTAVTSDVAGDVSFEAIRIAFRVNGGPPQSQEIPSGVRVCFGDPRPQECG